MGIPVTVEFPADGTPLTREGLQRLFDTVPVLPRHAPAAPRPAPTTVQVVDPDEAQGWYVSGVNAMMADLQAAQAWPEGFQDEKGRGWEKLCADIALKLQRYAAAANLDEGSLQEQFILSAPQGGYINDKWLRDKWRSQTAKAEKQGPWPLPDNFGSVGSIFQPRQAPRGESAPPPPPNLVNITNSANALGWLRHEVGTGRLDGVFARGSDLVFTAGERIQVLSPPALAARVNNRYDLVRVTPKGVPEPALITPEVTTNVVFAPDDLPNVRPLNGVAHSPIVRADGSILNEPGYDEASGILYQLKGTPVPAVPHSPTATDVASARNLIDHMLTDFAFVTPADRANYIGAMLTPLLRLAVPAPYKMLSIEAHQPGSGKSFLGRALISLHGGVEQSEAPQGDEEWGKTIGGIFDQTTGGVVMFDNVSGVIRSSFMAGLLTQAEFSIRRLGTSQRIEAANDRLWVITGNNSQAGGDLARRIFRTMVDPGVPNPELRTNFAIPYWENWVRTNRHRLLWSLLVLVRHWFVAGCPREARGSDSYADWISAVGGILATAGIPGRFDALVDGERAISDADTEELALFLYAVRRVFGGNTWQVKDLLARMSAIDGADPTQFVPAEAIPEFILASQYSSPTSVNTRLGRWLLRNAGRWADNMSVVKEAEVGHSALWRVRSL